MTLHLFLEILSVILGVFYLILMIKENIWCWIFGIVSSAITIYLYVHVTLYLEAGLNFYYVLAGIYGWIYWYQHKKENNLTPIVQWKRAYHLVNIALGLFLGVGLGYIMQKYTNSERPYVDALITVFSFSATYLEARKVLSTWYYWFVLNAFSIGLMVDRELYFFAILSMFYTGMCILGYKKWKTSYAIQLKEAQSRED